MGKQEWKQEFLSPLKPGISAIFNLLGLFASGIGEASHMMIGGREEEKQQIFPVTFFFLLFLLCEGSQERGFRVVLIL